MTLPELTTNDVLRPEWSVSPRVRALVTTRNGGVSLPPFGTWRDGVDGAGGLNLGRKSGDDPAHVEANRTRLMKLTARDEAAWLSQVHGATVVSADDVLAATQRGEPLMQADARLLYAGALSGVSSTVCRNCCTASRFRPCRE